MGAEVPGAIKLKCSVKNYDWGKVGKESAVARLCSKNSGEETNDDEPYAEFWMGSHESGLSYVIMPVGFNGGFSNCCLERDDDYKLKNHNSLSLKDWIARNPTVLGDKVLKKWGPNLPFLFKVLSVAKALSIQAHPDKKLAEILHKQQPAIYKDDNHKPEMALAITEFEALCGFIGLQELKTVVHTVPEIIELVGRSCTEKVLTLNDEEGDEKLKEILQSLFTGLMSVRESVISEVVSKLISRLNLKREVRELTDKEELVIRLAKQYPGDIGVIAAFLFNYVKLNPGEALYLGANEPHAYIQGDCVECMATSDNVVRAGLTPKNRDVQTLCSMLTYKQGSAEILSGVASIPYTVKYLPPFDEFEVDRCNLPREESTAFPAVPGPSVFVVMSGEGTMHVGFSRQFVAEGDVLFAPADTEVTVESALGLNLYRAGVNSRFFEESEYTQIQM